MTARNTLKRTLGAGLIVAASALGITALGAGTASANVPNGVYTLKTTTVGIPAVDNVAIVRGNSLEVRGPLGTQFLPLHHTAHGAYADSGITRYLFTYRGNGRYSGQTVVGPVAIGDATLIKR